MNAIYVPNFLLGVRQQSMLVKWMCLKWILSKSPDSISNVIRWILNWYYFIFLCPSLFVGLSSDIFWGKMAIVWSICCNITLIANGNFSVSVDPRNESWLKSLVLFEETHSIRMHSQFWYICFANRCFHYF